MDRIRDDPNHAHLGFDCSLFLQNEDLDDLPRDWTKDSSLGEDCADADGRADGKSGLFGHDWRNGTNLSSRHGWLAKLIPNKVKSPQKIIAPTRLTNIPGAIK